MKQNITKEQWEELSEEQKYKFWSVFEEEKKLIDWYVHHGYKEAVPSIGQLIEFLGEDLDIANRHGIWDVRLWFGLDSKQFPAIKLIDALWEATKYKLNNPTPNEY